MTFTIPFLQCPDIAGSWVSVEDADDNESVCGVDMDSDDTVVNIPAGVEVVVEAEDVPMIAVRVVVGELALWMASKKPAGHCNFCARWRHSTSAGIADSWLMDAEDMSGKWPERESRLRIDIVRSLEQKCAHTTMYHNATSIF